MDNKTWVICHDCDGEGKLPCNYCGGDGECECYHCEQDMECDECWGSGVEPCYACDALGGWWDGDEAETPEVSWVLTPEEAQVIMIMRGEK